MPEVKSYDQSQDLWIQSECIEDSYEQKWQSQLRKMKENGIANGSIEISNQINTSERIKNSAAMKEAENLENLKKEEEVIKTSLFGFSQSYSNLDKEALKIPF